MKTKSKVFKFKNSSNSNLLLNKDLYLNETPWICLNLMKNLLVSEDNLSSLV